VSFPTKRGKILLERTGEEKGNSLGALLAGLWWKKRKSGSAPISELKRRKGEEESRRRGGGSLS